MATYTLPRPTFEILTEALGERQKAEIFAKAIESAITTIEEKAKEVIVEKKSQIKMELRDELRNELVTRELFEERLNVIEERFKGLEKEINERFNVVDEKFNVVEERFKRLENEMNGKFKGLNLKLNILIGIAFIALTFANPNFVQLVEKIFGF